MSIDISMVFRERIEQIERDEKEVIHNKKWSKLAKLNIEKVNLETRIKEIEAKKIVDSR